MAAVARCTDLHCGWRCHEWRQPDYVRRDTIKVNPSSIITIHKCWTIFVGGYNADESEGSGKSAGRLGQDADEIYKRKTGLTDADILGMMAETTYYDRTRDRRKRLRRRADRKMPSRLASRPAQMDGHCSFGGGHALSRRECSCRTPSQQSPRASAAVLTNKKPEEVAGQKGGNSMTKEEPGRSTRTRLQRSRPRPEQLLTLRPQTNSAVQAERDRLAAIDEVAGLFDPQLVHEAEHGDTPALLLNLR